MINFIHWFLLKIDRCPYCRTKLTELEYGGSTKLGTITWHTWKCPKCERKKR